MFVITMNVKINIGSEQSLLENSTDVGSCDDKYSAMTLGLAQLHLDIILIKST